MFCALVGGSVPIVTQGVRRFGPGASQAARQVMPSLPAAAGNAVRRLSSSLASGEATQSATAVAFSEPARGVPTRRVMLPDAPLPLVVRRSVSSEPPVGPGPALVSDRSVKIMLTLRDWVQSLFGGLINGDDYRALYSVICELADPDRHWVEVAGGTKWEVPARNGELPTHLLTLFRGELKKVVLNRGDCAFGLKYHDALSQFALAVHLRDTKTMQRLFESQNVHERRAFALLASHALGNTTITEAMLSLYANPDELADFLLKALDALQLPQFPDTVYPGLKSANGVEDPQLAGSVVRRFASKAQQRGVNVGGLKFSCHTHDSLGLAVPTYQNFVGACWQAGMTPVIHVSLPPFDGGNAQPDMIDTLDALGIPVSKSDRRLAKGFYEVARPIFDRWTAAMSGSTSLTPEMADLVRRSKLPGGMMGTLIPQVRTLFDSTRPHVTTEGLVNLRSLLGLENFPTEPQRLTYHDFLRACLYMMGKLGEDTQVIDVTPASQAKGATAVNQVVQVATGKGYSTTAYTSSFTEYVLQQDTNKVRPSIRQALVDTWFDQKRTTFTNLPQDLVDVLRKCGGNRQQADHIIKGYPHLQVVLQAATVKDTHDAPARKATVKDLLDLVAPAVSQYSEEEARGLLKVCQEEWQRMKTEGSIETRFPELFSDWEKATRIVKKAEAEGHLDRISKLIGYPFTRLEAATMVATLPDEVGAYMLEHYGNSTKFPPQAPQFKTPQAFDAARKRFEESLKPQRTEAMKMAERDAVTRANIHLHGGYAGDPDILAGYSEAALA